MNIEKCHLCGGKVSGGVCADCGMKKSYITSKSRLNDNGEREPRPDRKQTEVRKDETVNQNNPTPVYNPKPPVKGNKKKFKLLPVLLIIFGIIPSIFQYANDYKQEQQNERRQAIQDSMNGFEYGTDEFDRYIHSYEDILETGEYYGVTLSEGSYEVGVDIPTGIYRITEVMGYGYLSWEDEENTISEWFILSGEDWEADRLNPSESSDLRFYTGAIIEIENDVQVRIETDNAQLGEGIYLMDAE